uniref:Uncharacterized protein n=1 Tax=Arundo donax TaxID=35708 RepID=A0A0A9E878_ARUDO
MSYLLLSQLLDTAPLNTGADVSCHYVSPIACQDSVSLDLHFSEISLPVVQ